MATKVFCGNPIGGTGEIVPAIEICSDMDKLESATYAVTWINIARHLDKLESAT